MGGFVTYFGNKTDDDEPVTLNEAFWYATGILLPNTFFLFTFPMFTLYLFKISCKIRIGCSGLIYRKILQMSKSSMDGHQLGKIVNLLSTDLRTFEDLVYCVYTLWRCPFDIVVTLIIIYMEIGAAAFIGVGFLVCFIPMKSKQTLAFEIAYLIHCLMVCGLCSLVWQKSGRINPSKSETNWFTNQNYERNFNRHSSDKNVCMGQTVCENCPPSKKVIFLFQQWIQFRSPITTVESFYFIAFTQPHLAKRLKRFASISTSYRRLVHLAWLPSFRFSCALRRMCFLAMPSLLANCLWFHCILVN